MRIPQLRIAVDHERAGLYGVSAAALTETLESLTGGTVVSQILDGARRFDVVLRLADEDRTTARLAEALVPTPHGRVPLGLLARVEEGDGPNQILREGARRRIVVLANTTPDADMAQVIAGIRAELARMPMPTGYTTALEGTFQAQEEAMRTIAVLALVSLGLIFVVLYSRYRSAMLAAIIMGNVPLALIGAVAAIWIAGQPLSVATLVGFVTLTGITTRNGILKVSHYLNLALHEGERWGLALVLRGQRGAADAGADDRALGRARADPAGHRRRCAGQGDPAPGRHHHPGRPGQRHAARHPGDADPVPPLRPPGAGTPARRGRGTPRWRRARARDILSRGRPRCRPSAP